MKAILRSINNFSCKLKQSNNLKYNISPKIRSNKYKSISGNGNVIIEDALNKNLKDYRVYGNTYQNSTSGKNLLNVPSTYTVERTNIDFSLQPGTYIVSCESPENYRRLLFFRWQENTNNGNYVYIEANTTSTEFTITKEVSKLNFYSRDGSSASTGNTSTYKNLMIRKSDITDSSYEPYTGGQPSPNPDYPQEIISFGDRTKNLFLTPDTPSQLNLPTYSKINKNSFTLYYNQTTTAVKSPYVRIDFDITQFKPNTRYTISKKYTVSGDNFRNVGAIRSYINGTNGSVINSNSFSFTTPSEISSLGVYFYLGYENRTVGESQITFYDIQIEENSSATPYEPYGYKIPVNVRSENLFDKDNANVLSAYFGISDNKDVITSASTNRMIYIPCKPNTTYTILKSLSNQFSIGYTYVQPTIGVQVYGIVEGTMNDGTKCWTGQDDINAIVHLSITTNENAKYLVLRYTNINNDNNSTWQEKLNVIQIVEGSTTPDKYIPYYNETTNIYLDEPLRGIGEYSDYIDFINGKIVRNIKKIVLDGSEDWYTSSGTSQVAFNKGVGYIHDTTKLPCNISINCQMPNNNLYFYSTGYSLAAWKTFLSTTNAIVYGRLSTPTEEDIELPNINLIEGKNIITIGTEVQGVFEAEYYSKEIIDISDYKYNLRKVED